MRLEIDAPGHEIVVVDLHHARENAVVVLAEQLGYYHAEHAHCAADHYVVELSCVFRLRYAKGIQHLAPEDGPAPAADKAGDKVLARQVAAELGCTCNLKLAKLCFQACHKLAELGIAGGIYIGTADTALVLSNLQPGEKLYQKISCVFAVFPEESIVFRRKIHQQREKGIAYPHSSVGIHAPLVAYTLEHLLQLLNVISICHLY